ncbi:thiolase family protein [Candidatus Woesearchaeota archaeon]|nr:thiolase family protein [Candidatus Woesearchaeota archaeon]
MLKYGATTDDFALVALKNHENAYLNPKARFYKRRVTLKQIRKSPIVASPLRLFDCSLSVNGAAAAIITKEKADIEIAGSGFYVDRLSAFESEDMTTWQATKLAAEEAYKQAGAAPDDIDVAELHDAFTPVEIISYEDLGFCKKGEGKNLIRKGKVSLNGELPVNTSGGLKAKGHPISATGIAQIYELVKQLRRDAGERQVSNANIALAQNIGGAGSSISVHILKKVSS